MTTDREPKIIIIVSVMISIAILIFAVVFMHNMSKDVDDINEQINEAKLEQESILREMVRYDKDVDVNEVKNRVTETTQAGKSVEKLQNDALKYYNDHYGPMDSVWADDYNGDEKILTEMKKLFPEASPAEQVLPWVVGWTCTWEFQSVFNYEESDTTLCWTCKDSDGRLLAIAYADYDAYEHVFEDLKIIHTKHEFDVDKK